MIFDEYGKEISGSAGPYNEGGEFKLICSVNGGKSTVLLNGFSLRVQTDDVKKA